MSKAGPDPWQGQSHLLCSHCALGRTHSYRGLFVQCLSLPCAVSSSKAESVWVFTPAPQGLTAAVGLVDICWMNDTAN